MSEEFGHDDVDTEFGKRLIEGLEEALAWKRGEISLQVRVYELMPAARVKAIRKRVAKSPKDFQRRFGVPARTVEGWEQGRRVDAPARQLLVAIERDPETMERLLAPEAA